MSKKVNFSGIFQIQLAQRRCHGTRDQRDPALRSLEDWKIGHFIQHGDQILTHWKAGERWIWDNTVLHLDSSARRENKYTMQISGLALQ